MKKMQSLATTQQRNGEGGGGDDIFLNVRPTAGTSKVVYTVRMYYSSYMLVPFGSLLLSCSSHS